MFRGESINHYHSRVEQRGLPELQSRRAKFLYAAFRRDEANVNGRILLKLLTPESQNSIVNFGGDYRAVIDIKKGPVSVFGPNDEIRNAIGKSWNWKEIEELILKENLTPQDIVKWRENRKLIRKQKKQLN